MRLVFMSACLQNYHHRLKHKLCSEVKISGKQTLSRKPYFSKNVLASKNMLGVKNVTHGGILKASKKTSNSHIF